MTAPRRPGATASTGLLPRLAAAPALAAVLFAVLCTALAPVAAARAPARTPVELPQGYAGAVFGSRFDGSPTRGEQQSKLWFHDGSWWALMLDATGATRVAELLPDHSWRPTDAVVDGDPVELGDALADGDTVYVLNRRRDTFLQLARLQYDGGTRTYRPAGRPSSVTDRGTEALGSLAKDTRGRLWVAFATSRNVQTTSSGDDGRTWTAPAVLGDTGTAGRRETAAVVSFDDSIGVLWSEQSGGAFRFAAHRDGTPPGQWTRETALAGPGRSEAALSLKVSRHEGGDTLVAAVVVAPGEEGEPPEAPTILVLARAPDGTWSEHEAGTVQDRLHSPVVQINQENDDVYLIADASGDVYAKKASLRDLSFPAGRGIPVLLGNGGRVTDVTASKQSIDARSGLVFLAQAGNEHAYRHVEMAVAGTVREDAPAAAPVPPPQRVDARALGGRSVGLRWPAVADATRWAPAVDGGMPASAYVVLRDGVEVGRTTETSFAESVPVAGRAYGYAVRAVDRADRRSDPAETTVDVPTDRTGTVRVLGVGLVAAAVTVALGAAAWRRRTKS